MLPPRDGADAWDMVQNGEECARQQGKTGGKVLGGEGQWLTQSLVWGVPCPQMGTSVSGQVCEDLSWGGCRDSVRSGGPGAGRFSEDRREQGCAGGWGVCVSGSQLSPGPRDVSRGTRRCLSPRSHGPSLRACHSPGSCSRLLTGQVDMGLPPSDLRP